MIASEDYQEATDMARVFEALGLVTLSVVDGEPVMHLNTHDPDALEKALAERAPRGVQELLVPGHGLVGHGVIVCRPDEVNEVTLRRPALIVVTS